MGKNSNFIHYKEGEFGNSLIKMDQFYDVKHNTTVLTANSEFYVLSSIFLAVF